MKQKVTKYLIALALIITPMLAPTLANAQAVQATYIDTGVEVVIGVPPIGTTITVGGSKLEFRLDGNLGGAVITGAGSNTLTGQFNVPDHVMTPLFSASVTGDLLNLLNTISIKAGINFLELFTGGIPVVGIESLNSTAATNNGIAFNTAITGVSFPTTGYFKYIGINAFQQCGELTGSLVIPASVTTIEHHAFQVCNKLTNIDLSGATSLQTIGTSAFDNCVGWVGDLVIPASVTKIDTYAFFRNLGMRSVTFKGTTLDMSTPHRVFSRCAGLEYIDMTSITTTTATAPVSLERPLVETDGYFFADLPAHTVVYLPNGTPASLITSLPTTGNMNYVFNGNCDWFYVQDGCDYYIPYSFTAAKATWNAAGTGEEPNPLATRTNSGKLVTAYLPFDFTLPASSGLQGFTMLDKKNEPVHVFRFKQQAATVPFNANTPYILRNASGAAITFPEATGTINVPKTPVSRIVYAADGVTTSYDGGVTAVDNTAGGTISDPVKGTWGFYGTTERVSNNTAVGWKALILSSGAWYDLNSDVNSPLSPLRAFLATSDGAVGAKPSFTLEDLNGNLIGGTNGIDGIDNNEPANSVETRVYNLNGQYLGKDINALPKGLYIVNGKKTIKK